MGGKGLVKAGKFGYRQMRPMRARDWVTLGAVAGYLSRWASTRRSSVALVCRGRSWAAAGTRWT